MSLPIYQVDAFAGEVFRGNPAAVMPLEQWVQDALLQNIAQENNCDVVSRFFGPQIGINEDPVTGSAHCGLVPYWAQRPGQDDLDCRQFSARGGHLACRIAGGRVFMTGTAVT